MHSFKKILVAIDLAGNDRFVAATLPTPTEEAIRQAEWVAATCGASLEYVSVLPQRTGELLFKDQNSTEQGDGSKTVLDRANEVLSEITEKSSRKGISASGKIVFGRCWVELTREVIRNEIDLVVAGTRRKSQFSSMLMGSTGIKLLRKCPCPVWITKPQSQDDERIDNILVAHDLTRVGEQALEIAASFAKKRNCHLHVFHAVDRGQSPWRNLFTADKAQLRINKQLKELDCKADKVKVEIIDGAPEDKILGYVKSNNIELVVMGTIARAGISGMLVGNTAEKILPFLPCSVLAVKPEGFISPVQLTANEYEDDLVEAPETT